MGAGRPGEGPRQASGSPLGWGRGCTPTGIPRQAAAASLPPSSSVPPPRPGPRGPGWKSGHFRSPEGWAEGRRVLWPQVAAALLTAVLGTNKLKLTRQCPSGSHPAVAVPWPLRLALSPPPPGALSSPQAWLQRSRFSASGSRMGTPPHIPEVGAGHWLYCCPRHYFKKHLPTELGAGTLEGLPGHGTGSPEEGRGQLSPTCPAPPCRPHLPRPLRSPPLRAAPLLPEKGTPPPVAPTNTHSQIPQLSR